MAESKQNTMQEHEIQEYDSRIGLMRGDEYPMLKDAIYLDHAGTTLYAKSLIDRFSAQLLGNLYGNPHTASPSSQRTMQDIDDIRHDVLRFFNADPEDFDIVFVANATAGIKLVAEALSSLKNGFWYGYHQDSHTSLVGTREVAAGGHRCFLSDEEVEKWIYEHREDNKVPQSSSFHTSDSGASDTSSNMRSKNASSPSLSPTSSVESFSNSGTPSRPQEASIELFAYPAQSNMNGRRLPLSWCKKIRQSVSAASVKRYTLLDAAALVSTSPLDLSDELSAPDFTVVSFYKIFGFPDLGALIVRKSSADVLLQKRYFGGGTVDMVLCQREQWHAKKSESVHAALEDGTLPIHGIMALRSALRVHTELFDSMSCIAIHSSWLCRKLFNSLSALKHANHVPVCELYTQACGLDSTSLNQGPVIAFNLLTSKGFFVSNSEVQKLASIRNIHLRNGGLCNPGGIAHALGLAPWEIRSNFSAGFRCGGDNDIVNGKPTGMLRVSLGAMSTLEDVERFVDFISEFFVERDLSLTPKYSLNPSTTRNSEELIYRISALMIYPIKSCAGNSIPFEASWRMTMSGLEWDREWCLVHRATKEVLSQKRYPRMACIRPELDFEAGILRVKYEPSHESDEMENVENSRVEDEAKEISIPLSLNPTLFVPKRQFNRSYLSSCNPLDTNPRRSYSSAKINSFFSTILQVPCQLARIPASSDTTTSSSATSASNASESPILAISTASLDHLNRSLQAKSPPHPPISASTFRANLILTPSSPPKPNEPSLAYAEETLTTLHLPSTSPTHTTSSSQPSTLAIKGPCKRCQMINISQTTGAKSRKGEPFTTLAKQRRRAHSANAGFGVFFGVHCGLNEEGAAVVKVGDEVVGVRRAAGTLGIGD